MNIVIDKLPNEYEGLRLNTGFRSSILFELLMQDENISQEDKIANAIQLMLEEPSEGYKNAKKAIEVIIKFYTMEKENKKTTEKQKKVFDYEEDADLLYSAFMKDYKIDLQDVELHWWKFKSLFSGLDENNMLIKVMGYRSVDLNKIKDKEQKDFYTKMQKQYSLKQEYKEDIGDVFW